MKGIVNQPKILTFDHTKNMKTRLPLLILSESYQEGNDTERYAIASIVRSIAEVVISKT